MKQLPAFPASYWLKFSDQPVKILPYDPRSQEVAAEYLQRLQAKLNRFPNTTIYLRGSTAFQIAGKGEIELGVVLAEDAWFEVIDFLTRHFGSLGNLEDDYARFNDVHDNFEIEIILMRGYTAVLDQKLHQFLANRSDLLAQYLQVKQQFSYSKREYYRQKDLFFRRLIALIPD
jgi:hypothetical protein